MRYAMVIDTRLCVGCMTCVVACKTENGVPDGLNRDWLTESLRDGDPATHLEIRSERCNHCEKPPCVPCCPTEASRVREGGIVLIDPEECIDCQACIRACPYGARFSTADEVVSKCTFCHHRLKAGLAPACVTACPTRCMHFGDLDDPQSEVSGLLRKRRHRVLKPELGQRPHVYYLVDEVPDTPPVEFTSKNRNPPPRGKKGAAK